jgi:opacity protein-like surface antigen
MKSVAIAALAAGSLAAFAPAHAQQSQSSQSGMYAGVNFSAVSYEESSRGTANLTSIGIKLGREINQHFAVEGRFGTGISDDNLGSGANDVSVDYYLGAYAKGILPLSPRIGLYGLAGVTYGKLSASGASLRLSSADADFSYGFGMDFGIGATTALNVEWMRMFEGSGYDLDAVSIGLNFKF